MIRRNVIAIGAALLIAVGLPATSQAIGQAPTTCPASVCSTRQASYADQAILLGQDYSHTKARSSWWWAVADGLICSSWRPPTLSQSSRKPRAGDGISYAVALLQGTISTWGGIPVLKVDGRYGSRTTAAVKIWQRQHGHRATGRMDSATWQHYKIRYCDPG